MSVLICISLSLLLQNDGRLRFSKQNVVYKSSKTGKVDSIPAGELNLAQWRRVCLGHGIKLGTSTGHIYKYDGFRDTVSVFSSVHTGQISGIYITFLSWCVQNSTYFTVFWGLEGCSCSCFFFLSCDAVCIFPFVISRNTIFLPGCIFSFWEIIVTLLREQSNSGILQSDTLLVCSALCLWQRM